MNAIKVLVTGAGGQLGIELMELLPRKGYEVLAATHEDLDIADYQAVERLLNESRPGLVINAAAYTNVDGCETNVGLAYDVNTLGPRNLAVACENLGCDLLHVSTNYVFDGESESPYEPFDAPGPVSVYARTKLAGEEYVKNLCSRWYIVRSAGVYGRGHNFVRTMLRVASERDTLKVKEDEYISPTYARDLAEGVLEILNSSPYGIYHVTNSGYCSWFEFALEIFRLSGVEIEVNPVPGSEYPLPADRPRNGVLSHLGSPELRHWREALRDYLRLEGQV